MSMNLTCKEVELWQTPTYITYICFSNGDGGWQGIKYRYIQWVKSSLNGKWNNKKDLDEAKEMVDSHINELNKFKSLSFGMQ